MSDIAFAIWMLGSAMVGASIGTVVMSVLAASRRADEYARTYHNRYCPNCGGVVLWDNLQTGYRCSDCGK